eukprot:381016-Alexandrium_andersonii.AAC.1
MAVIEAAKTFGEWLLVVLDNECVQEGVNKLRNELQNLEGPLYDLWKELQLVTSGWADGALQSRWVPGHLLDGSKDPSTRHKRLDKAMVQDGWDH